MRLITLGDKVKRTFENQLKLILRNANVIRASKKINDQKLRELADQLNTELPGCGFALITFDIEQNETCANYVSNLTDEYMIKALEIQLETLKKGKAGSAATLINSGL